MLFLMLCCKLLHKLADMILHKDTTCIYIIQTSLFDISYSCNTWMFAQNHLLRFNHVLVSPFWAYLINRFFYSKTLFNPDAWFIIPYTHVELLMAVCLLLTLTLCRDLYVEVYRGHQKHWKQGLMIEICKQALISSRSVVRTCEGSVGLSHFCVTQGTESAVIN